jgi:phosphomannomutase
MERRFGRFRYVRRDIACPNFILVKEKFRKIAKSPPTKLSNKSVVEVKTYDGVKFILSDRSWLLFRLSGTEPILRIYAEASSQRQAENLVQLGRKMMGLR